MNSTIGILLTGITIFLAGGASAQPDPALRYWLELDSNVLHVTLHYNPVDPDSTVFTYGIPQFGGQNDIFDGVRKVQVSSPGRERIDTGDRRIVVYYPDYQPVTITYDIVDTHTPEQGVRGELFRPIIQKDYFYTHGVNIFLNPDFRSKEKPALHSVGWKKPPPFRVFFGFDPENDGSTSFPGPIAAFQMSPVTGAADLTVDRLRLGNMTNYLVLRSGGITDDNKKAVLDYFTRYNDGIRQFWNDEEEGSFSLILQPFQGVVHDISGVAFDHGFIGKYSGDTLMSGRRMFVISHEVGHHWIGQQLSLGIENQWFNEGFNDYGTYYNLLQSRLMTPEAFETGLNEVFQAHYSSAVKNTPNDSVFLNYWKMGDYNRLPYRRGCLFAFYLDNQIIRKSKGRQNIRDLLLALAGRKKAKGSGEELTTADFIAVASTFLPQKQVEQAIAQYITRGDPIPFTNKLLLPEYRIRMEGEIPVLTIRDKGKCAGRFRVD